jgi:hypothetical protein
VIARFGSWERVCALLGQPYRLGRLPGDGRGIPRRWSDEAIVAALRDLEAQLGHPLTANILVGLRSGAKGKAGAFPSYKTVQARFGSWKRVAALLRETVAPATPAGPPS